MFQCYNDTMIQCYNKIGGKMENLKLILELINAALKAVWETLFK